MNTSTGRIEKLLHPIAREILFGEGIADAEVAELQWITEIDRAHLVMLVERGLVERSVGCRLLAEITTLRASHFEPLRGVAIPRGLYLAYENYLIEQLGPNVGGRIHIGRSRNDINATLSILKSREPILDLITAGCDLLDALLDRARELDGVVIAMFTHHQPALPSTVGHYLSGFAQSLGRDIEAHLDAMSGLRRSPFGAGAVCGSTLPIDPNRTASLLGFDAPTMNSIDAVAARDWVLRVEATCAITAIGLSRLAADLLIWCGELGFMRLPDDLVGSSSAMPQKRNPFLLEHIQGRASAPLGAFMASACAMHAMPYTNSVAVGTEACNRLRPTLDGVRQSLDLMRLVIRGFSIDTVRAAAPTQAGYTTATELANRLVVEAGLDFRSAHHAVGELVSEAERAGNLDLAAAARGCSNPQFSNITLSGLDPAAVATSANFGGGPAPDAVARAISSATDDARRNREALSKWRRQIDSARNELDAQVAALAMDVSPDDLGGRSI